MKILITVIIILLILLIIYLIYNNWVLLKNITKINTITENYVDSIQDELSFLEADSSMNLLYDNECNENDCEILNIKNDIITLDTDTKYNKDLNFINLEKINSKLTLNISELDNLKNNENTNSFLLRTQIEFIYPDPSIDLKDLIILSNNINNINYYHKVIDQENYRYEILTKFNNNVNNIKIKNKNSESIKIHKIEIYELTKDVDKLIIFDKNILFSVPEIYDLSQNNLVCGFNNDGDKDIISFDISNTEINNSFNFACS